MLTYLGKIISAGTGALYVNDEDADNIVANDVPWSTIRDTHIAWGMPVANVRNDDGSAINVETQCVQMSEVPDDTTFLFVLEPAFVEVTS